VKGTTIAFPGAGIWLGMAGRGPLGLAGCAGGLNPSETGAGVVEDLPAPVSVAVVPPCAVEVELDAGLDQSLRLRCVVFLLTYGWSGYTVK
jgi:hypothetical protein